MVARAILISAMSESVVVGGKFVLRVGGEQLLERQGARLVLWFQGLTGPERDPRGETGEKVVAGDLAPDPPIGPAGRREAFDSVGHVGFVGRPLRAGLRAASAKVMVLRKISVVGGQIAIAVSAISPVSSMFMGGRPKIPKSNFSKMHAREGGRSRRSSGRDSGVGGTAHAEPLVSIPPHSRPRRASRSFRF